MKFSMLILVAQMTCWHVAGENGLYADNYCPPSTPEDQGAAIFVDDGTSVTVAGEFLFDGGWAMCRDGHAPDVSIEQRNGGIWETRIDCRGKGNLNMRRPNENPQNACARKTSYAIRYIGEFWQIHIFCPAPETTS